MIDTEGRLLVFFSENRFKQSYRKNSVDIQNYFFDIYSGEVKFTGRVKFEYGFPELVADGIIYSRVKVDRDTWKITAVRLTSK